MEDYRLETLKEIKQLKEQLESAYDNNSLPYSNISFSKIQELTELVNYLFRLYYFTCERNELRKKNKELHNELVLDILDERQSCEEIIDKLYKKVGGNK